MPSTRSHLTPIMLLFASATILSAGCKDKYDRLAECQALMDQQNACVEYLTFEEQFPDAQTPDGSLPPSESRRQLIEATQRLMYERNPECRLRARESWDDDRRAEARLCELRLDDFRRNGA
jgi:hypothetical protein